MYIPPPKKGALVTSADVAQFERLVHRIAFQFYPSLRRFHAYEDLIALGRAHVWTSLTHWQEGRGASKLTYLSRALVHCYLAEQKRWRARSRRGAWLEDDIDEMRRTAKDDFVPRFQIAADTPDPVEAIDAQRGPSEDSIAASMARLSYREQRVLTLRAEGKNLREIGDAFGVSRERIRQIEQLAIKRIRLDLLGEA